MYPGGGPPDSGGGWQAGRESGHAADKIGIVSHFYVGATSQAAHGTFYPHYRSYLSDSRGATITRPVFDAMTSPQGALMVGRPHEVTDRVQVLHPGLHGLNETPSS